MFIRDFFNRLEEYLEILFIQIRDLIRTNEEQNDLGLFIMAWLDEDRKKIQQTQV